MTTHIPQHLAEHMDNCPNCGVTCALCPLGEELHEQDKELVSKHFAKKRLLAAKGGPQ